MPKLNSSFSHLKQRYLFALIAEKIKPYQQQDLVNLGIGDIARPLLKPIADTISLAVYEMTCIDTLKGYGPETGYGFLKRAILNHEYGKFGFDEDEVFISEGINPEITVFHELFSSPLKVALQDPSYPAYHDSHVIAGTITPTQPPFYLPISKDFIPAVPDQKVDLIYLCSPNNPTGTALTRKELENWVTYALENDSIILFDGAYEAFVQSQDVPKSIYEIKDAKKCCVEFRSFSKSAGFTGLRCGYVICPKEIEFDKMNLNQLWTKYKTIRSNGVSYPIQKGAEKTFDPTVQKALKEQIQSYLNQTKYLKTALEELGLQTFGGIDAPFIFLKTPHGYNSWEFFDFLLEEFGIVVVPGSGFGQNGEGYIRLSGLITEATFERAKQKFQTLVKRGLYEASH
jgi:LL-diaminopimelate aminotransferase